MAAQSTEILFSKNLTVTDIQKRLAVPTKILSSLPGFNGGHAVDIRLVHGTKTWPIVCTVRPRGYSKPVFSVGWRKFVTDNKLVVGDRITMYKVQDEDGNSYHYMVEMEHPAARNQDGALPFSALSLTHEVHGTDFVKETDQLSEAADEPIKQEGANIAADTLVEDIHVTTKLHSTKLCGTNISDEANSKAHLETERKCFGGITKDIGMDKDEPTLVSPYMAKKENEINFFGLAADTVSDQSLSLDMVQRQPIRHAELLNLDLTLAPPNA